MKADQQIRELRELVRALLQYAPVYDQTHRQPLKRPAQLRARAQAWLDNPPPIEYPENPA